MTRYTLVYLALNSGLRVSELAGLKISNLQLDDKENYLIVQRGKGGRKRDVYLDKELVKRLKGYITVSKRAWSESTDDSAPFPS